MFTPHGITAKYVGKMEDEPFSKSNAVLRNFKFRNILLLKKYLVALTVDMEGCTQAISYSCCFLFVFILI